MSDAWLAHAAVAAYEGFDASAQNPFDNTLGKALYAMSFAGGPQARRDALAREVAPVFIDMALLAAADEFWPTPGSTMSQSVCFMRAVWQGRAGVPRLASCEDVVRGWGDGKRMTPTM